MIIRRLEQKEHDRTRKLWEEVFAEDSEKFLDYYYSEVTQLNEIYVVEGRPEINTETARGIKRGIQAMLHLNPFIIQAGSYCGKCNYIVAVATRRPYRGRGYMAELLKTSCREMYRAQQPFTFLMPAAEAIYYPHGFRFIYRQKRGWITAENGIPELSCEPASQEDLREAAILAERVLGDQDVYIRRSEAYYRRLLKEQASENGGVLLLKKNRELRGILCYASDGERMEMREPVLDIPCPDWEGWLSQAAYAMTGKEGAKVFCEGYGEERRPLIMARVVYLPAFFACFTAREDMEGKIFVSDTMLSGNNGIWLVSGKKGQPVSAVKIAEAVQPDDGERLEKVQQEGATEDAGIVRAAQLAEEDETRHGAGGFYKDEKEEAPSPVPVSLLMACLSGDQSVEEAAKAEHTELPEAAKRLLGQIQPWKKVFINEVV